MTRDTPAFAVSSTAVLVIGGGPAGLAVAVELGMRGVEVVVVEPRRSVSHARPRAKTTSARTMELFRRWGIAKQIRAAAALPVQWSDRVTFCATVTGPEITHFNGVFGLDLTNSELAAEAGQQITQPAVEEVLRQHLADLPSVKLLLGWRAVLIAEAADGFQVRIEAEDGTGRELHTQWLIGADGPRSLVRQFLGAAYVGAPAGRPNVNITFRSAQLANRIPHPRSVHYWVLNAARPGVVGPLDLDGTWWAIATGTATVDDDAEAQAIVADLIGADVDIQVLATDPWQARMLLADTYGVGRAFLIGDAAHQNPPWGGHGFNTGIGDAVNLGWKLAAVIQGWAPPALLASYEAERRPIAQRTIDIAASNMSTLSIDLADPDLAGEGESSERARARAAVVVQRTKAAEFHSIDLVLGYGYTPAANRQVPSPGEFRPAVEAGNRLPHHWLADGRSLYDDLGPGFTVIGAAAAVAGIVKAADERALPLTILEPAPRAEHTVVLVRPDQHIAWVGPAPLDPAAVIDAALLGFPSCDAVATTRSRNKPSPRDSQRRLENNTMSAHSDNEQFSHIAAAGPARGTRITGKLRRPSASDVRPDTPLVMAVHGGTYTSDYFDIPGYSLLDRADELGIPIIALDRPGYGDSAPVPASESIIVSNAEVLEQVIGELWDVHGNGTSGIFLIGHSIGGAIVTAIAAQRPSWPLLGIAVSGCLVQVPDQARDTFNALPDIEMIDLPTPMKDAVMFGPAWTHDPSMPSASYPSNTLIPRAELIDINNGWIGRVRSVAARVTVPVQIRQGEFDYLWITDQHQVSEFAAAFTASPSVDARLVAGAGHCIDFHRAGNGFQLGQLGFALECCIQEVTG